ncbi:hypothetical protein VSR82_39275 [Burkholderia sp. JPY481]
MHKLLGAICALLLSPLAYPDEAAVVYPNSDNPSTCATIIKNNFYYHTGWMTKNSCDTPIRLRYCFVVTYPTEHPDIVQTCYGEGVRTSKLIEAGETLAIFNDIAEYTKSKNYSDFAAGAIISACDARKNSPCKPTKENRLPGAKNLTEQMTQRLEARTPTEVTSKSSGEQRQVGSSSSHDQAVGNSDGGTDQIHNFIFKFIDDNPDVPASAYVRGDGGPCATAEVGLDYFIAPVESFMYKISQGKSFPWKEDYFMYTRLARYDNITADIHPDNSGIGYIAAIRDSSERQKVTSTINECIARNKQEYTNVFEEFFRRHWRACRSCSRDIIKAKGLANPYSE